jgi:hypothetical protein
MTQTHDSASVLDAQIPPHIVTFLMNCNTGSLRHFPRTDFSFTKPASVQRKILFVMDDDVNVSTSLLTVYSNVALRIQMYLSQSFETISNCKVVRWVACHLDQWTAKKMLLTSETAAVTENQLNIVAFRPVARQRQRNKQIYNGLY